MAFVTQLYAATHSELPIPPPPSHSEMERLVYNEISCMNEFFQENHLNKLVDTEARLAIQYDDLLPMQPRYQQEVISYAEYGQRSCEYQVFAYQGKLYDSRKNLITTQPLDFNHGAILVMDSRGNLFLTHKKRDEIHHSTFLASGSVAYACMLEVQAGVIVKEESWSGHYMPNSSNQAQFHDRLNKNFIKSIDENSITIFLSARNARRDRMIHTCVISSAPLFEAVKLPCGHTFNQFFINKLHEMSKKCPLDNIPFEVSDIVLDPHTRLDAEMEYQTYLQDTKVFNSEILEKIHHLKTDDQELQGIDATLGDDRPGVYLTLQANSPLSRVCQIATRIGLIHSSTTPLSMIKVNASGAKMRGKSSISLSELHVKAGPKRMLTLRFYHAQ